MAASMPPNGVLKRLHPDSTRAPPTEVIELSSDESDHPPPPKRQKSITPVISGINGIKHGLPAKVKSGSTSVNLNSGSDSQSFPGASSTSTTIKKPIANTQVKHEAPQESPLFRNVPSWAAKCHAGPQKPPSTPNASFEARQQSALDAIASRKSSTSKPGSARVNGLGNTERRQPHRRSISPKAARYHAYPSDDDLKILENFKIADGKTTKQKSRPAKSHVTASSPIQPPRVLKLDFSDRRDTLPTGLAHRPSPSLAKSAPKTVQKPTPIPFATQIPKAKPSYHFVSAPPSQFELVVPLSQDAFVSSKPKQGPIPYIVDEVKEKNALLAELKISTEPINTRLADVEKYFGQTGFSVAFGTEVDELRLRNAASKKQRKVRRKSIKLDWGEVPPPAPREDHSSTDLVHPTQQVKQLLTARFQEDHDPPLTFANDINDRRLNGKFQFVDRYVYRAGVRTADPANNYGCRCAGSCDPIACHCLTNQIGDPCFAALQPIQPYTRRLDGLVVLSLEYITNQLTPAANHFEISECNTDCSCPPSCFNKIVQRGRTVPLEIFETAKCGFGVRSSVPIVRGQFIDLYLGEVITQLELERRENAKEENASSYIYSLDWFAQQNCYHVDGENFGTAMRFVNHCCTPNARSFTVQTHKGDKHVYHLAFFAIQDIPAGTEICIDYSPQEEGKYLGSESGEGLEGEEEQQEEQEGIARCYCGAANCRKFLWRGAGRKRKKRKMLKHE